MCFLVKGFMVMEMGRSEEFFSSCFSGFFSNGFGVGFLGWANETERVEIRTSVLSKYFINEYDVCRA